MSKSKQKVSVNDNCLKESVLILENVLGYRPCETNLKSKIGAVAEENIVLELHLICLQDIRQRKI